VSTAILRGSPLHQERLKCNSNEHSNEDSNEEGRSPGNFRGSGLESPGEAMEVITESAFASEEDFQKATLEALSARLSGLHGRGFTATPFLSPFGFDAGIALRTGSRANFKVP
jgi:hypothetical protein